MKHILDSTFRYRPSFDTDVRKTFDRIRRQKSSERPTASTAGAPTRVKVLQLDPLKKAIAG